jgi:hypothetical protein
MRRVRAVLRFAWEFVVGDDWRIAATVAAAIGVTALLGDDGVRAWWLLPIVVIVVLTTSIWTLARTRR